MMNTTSRRPAGPGPEAPAPSWFRRAQLRPERAVRADAAVFDGSASDSEEGGLADGTPAKGITGYLFASSY